MADGCIYNYHRGEYTCGLWEEGADNEHLATDEKGDCWCLGDPNPYDSCDEFHPDDPEWEPED